MKYKGIIFDLDGVICHTDKYHYQAWKKLADKLGIYFDQEINNRLRGVSRMESFDIILEKYHVGIVPGLVRFKTKLVPVKLQGLFHVYDSKADAGYSVHVLLHGIGE